MFNLILKYLYQRKGSGERGDNDDDDTGDFKQLNHHYQSLCYNDFNQNYDPFQYLNTSFTNYNNSSYDDGDSSNSSGDDSGNTKEIYIPDILWRKILNYLVSHYFKNTTTCGITPDATSTTHSQSKYSYMEFLKISLVCKRWAARIVPFLSFGEVIVSGKELSLFSRLYSKGIMDFGNDEQGGTGIQFNRIQMVISQPKQPHHFKMMNDYNQYHENRYNTYGYQSYLKNPLQQLTVTIHNNIDRQVASELLKFIKLSHCKVLKIVPMEGHELCPELVDSIATQRSKFRPYRQQHNNNNNNNHQSTLFFPNLEVIDMGGSRSGEPCVRFIESFINFRPSTISILNLESCALGEKGLYRLCNALDHNNSIHTLNLSFNRIGDSVEQLTDLLISKKNLTSLNLNENRIGHIGGVAISKLLDHSTHIKKLILSTNPFSPESLNLLMASINQNIGLEKVSLAMMSNEINLAMLGNCLIHDSIIVSGLTHRRGCPLKSLNVMVNDLGKNGDFFKCLLDNSTLESINLSNTKLNGESKAMLATVLARNNGLKKIDLSYAFTDNDSRDIIRSLTINNTITSINLSLNSLQPEEGDLLGEVLTKNTTLTRLNIGNNIIGRGCIPILRALKSNKTLKHLNLRKNLLRNIIPCGLIFQVLSQNNTLVSLDLCQNYLGESTGKEIAFALPYNSNLKHLDLSTNQFPYQVGLVLYHSLQYNQSLTSLGLSGNLFGTPVTSMIKNEHNHTFNIDLTNDYGPTTVSGYVKNTLPVVPNQPKTKKFFFF